MSGPHIYDPQFHVTAGLERPAVRRMGPVAHVFPILVASNLLVPGGPADPILAAQSADALLPHDRARYKFFPFFVHSFSLPWHTSTSFFLCFVRRYFTENCKRSPRTNCKQSYQSIQPTRPEALWDRFCMLNGTGQRDNNTTFSHSTGPWNKPPLGGTMWASSTNKFAVHAIVVAFHAESLTKGAIPV